MNWHTLVSDDAAICWTFTLFHVAWEGFAIGAAAAFAAALLRSRTSHARYVVYVGALALMAASLPTTWLVVRSRTDVEFAATKAALRPSNDGSPLQHDLGTRSRAETKGDRRDMAIDTSIAINGDSDSGTVGAPHGRPVAGDARGKLLTDRGDAPNHGLPAPDAYSERLVPSARWTIHDFLGGLQTAFHLTLRPFAPWAAGAYWLIAVAMWIRLASSLLSGRRLRGSAVDVTDDAWLAAARRLAERCEGWTPAGKRRSPHLAWCADVRAPLVVGIFRPAVLLPMSLASGLAPSQIESLLLHELAHIRRHDLAVNLLQRVVESFLFFHPVAWWLSRRIGIEREQACDDAVLAAGWRPTEYADALVRMAELCLAGKEPARIDSLTLAAAGDTPTHFRRRILRLLGESGSPRFGFERITAFALVAFVLLAIASPLLIPAVAEPRNANPTPNVASPIGEKAESKSNDDSKPNDNPRTNGDDRENGNRSNRHRPTADRLLTADVRRVSENAKPIEGMIVSGSADGKPARGVVVEASLVGGMERKLGSVTSDENGRFTLPAAWWIASHLHGSWLQVFARDADGRIAWSNVNTTWMQQGYQPVRDGETFRLAKSNKDGEEASEPFALHVVLLAPADSVEGRLVGSDNRPIPGARVQIVSLEHPANRSAGWHPYASTMDSPLPHATTDIDGRFKLNVPAGSRVDAWVMHPDWVTRELQRLPRKADEPFVMEPAGRIAGRVTSPPPDGETTGPPAANAIVAVSGISSDGRIGSFATVRTDDEGRYEVGGLLPDSYSVFAMLSEDERSPVSTFVIPVRVEAGKTREQSLSMVHVRRLTGRLIDAESSEPIVDAWVSARVGRQFPIAHRESIGRSTRSDADGRFTLYVPPGVCHVYAHAEGWRGNGQSERTFHLPAEGNSPNIALKLRRSNSQNGSFFSDAGAASDAGDAAAAADDPPEEMPARPTLHVELTNAEGNPIGEYHVRTVFPDREFVAEWSLKMGPAFDKEFDERYIGRKVRLLVDVPGFAPITTRDITISAEMKPLTLSLEAPTYVPVRGEAIGADGKPIAGALVQVRRIFHGTSTEFPWGLETTTDDDGRFTLTHLRAGEVVSISVRRDGLGECESKPFAVQGTEPIDVPPIRFTLPDQSVSGQVTDQDGLPVAGANVQHLADPRRETATGDDGRFTLTDLPAGRLRLDLRKGKDEAKRFVLTGQKNVRLFLPLRSLYNRPEFRLTVNLETPQDKPITKADYYLVDLTARRWLMSSKLGDDRNENVREVTLDLGSWLRRDPDHELAFVIFADEFASSGAVPITTQPKIEPLTVKLEPSEPAKLVGRIVDAEGMPVAGASIGVSFSLGNDENPVVGEAWRYVGLDDTYPKSDADGRFTLPNLQRGQTVALYVNADGYAGVSSERTKIDRSGEMALPDLRLRKASRLFEGTVVDEDQRPIAGATVVLHDIGFRKTATTDELGRYRMTAVPEGDLLFAVRAAGFDGIARRVSVSDAGHGKPFELKRDPSQFTPIE